MLQIGRRSGVVGLHVSLIELRQAAESSSHQFVAGNTERVDVIVHQSVKRIHAARAAGIEKGESCRSCKCQATAITGDVGNVVGNQAVGARQHLLFVPGIVEALTRPFAVATLIASVLASGRMRFTQNTCSSSTWRDAALVGS